MENAGDEEEVGGADGRGEYAVEQIEWGRWRDSPDFLADEEDSLNALGENEDGEPEVFAIDGTGDEEPEDGEADEAGSDGVGVEVDEAGVA